MTADHTEDADETEILRAFRVIRGSPLSLGMPRIPIIDNWWQLG
jgi:hypothetical protein